MAVTRFETRRGARVYQMPVKTCPGNVNNIYLIVDGDHVTLFDVGSGLPDSNAGLEARMAEVRERFGETGTLASVQHVVISHAHIDHFGWVGRFTRESDAAVYVHELDARVLVNFEERIVLASEDLRVFMERAGVKPELRAEMEEAYRFSKLFFKSVEIDHVVKDRERIINGYRVHHTPRHCPGQICLEVDDLLFTADHVLSRITPHQSPAPAPAPAARRDHPLLRPRALSAGPRARAGASRHPALAARPRGAHRRSGRSHRWDRQPSRPPAQPGAGHLPGAPGPGGGVQASLRGQERLYAPAGPRRGGRPRRVPLPARRVAHREPRGRHPGAQPDHPVRGPARPLTEWPPLKGPWPDGQTADNLAYPLAIG